jgi:hypothetical protein
VTWMARPIPACGLAWLLSMGGLTLARGQALAETPLRVCEVLENLARYRGKTIAVRGMLYQSREITALGDTTCKHPLRTGDHQWPPALDLEYSGYTPRDEATVTFQTDLENVETTGAEVRAIREKAPGRDVWVTVVGHLRARDQYNVRLGGDGKWHGQGYGNLGIYPARFVIRKMYQAGLAP